MESKTQHGYLVLADISGYTSYLVKTELEHAQEILTDLLEIIVGQFRTLLTIAKLEGDAVFAYAPAAKTPRGETVLELLEATYAAFRDRAEAIRRRTTCDCNACRNIPALDLKFMAHHGDYVVQNVSGINELVGSDVNLVHRLLKNHVTEATGWRAYALFTEAGLRHMGVRSAGMHEQAEAYEYLGEVKTYSLDLRQRYQELAEARRVVIAPEEAFLTVIHDYPVPPPVLWEWLNDPRRRVLYTLQSGLQIVPAARPGGRTGVGSLNHCLHGKNLAMVEAVLDWRPFEYFTVEQTYGGVKSLIFCRLTPAPNGGTRLVVYMKGQMPVPGFLNRPAYLWMHTRFFPMAKMFEKLERVMTEALAQEATTESAAAPAPA